MGEKLPQASVAKLLARTMSAKSWAGVVGQQLLNEESYKMYMLVEHAGKHGPSG
jgi:hypothetical protein